MLSRLSWNLLKPEYFSRPGALLARRLRTRRVDRCALIHGGLEIELLPDEMISSSIRRKGYYDLVMSETVYRLLDPGETAVDVGAHIGYVTGLAAERVGRQGRVVSLEPHPVLHRVLEANAQRWREVSSITLHNVAAGEKPGSTTLRIPRGWEHNRGAASVVSQENPERDGDRVCAVACATLDELLGRESVHLLKIDVEGFEPAVLRGAARLLAEGRCRDIVFEDFGQYPTEVMRMLEAAGYEISSLARGLVAPRLAPPDRSGVHPRNDPNYLATRDPRRARERMRRRGYFLLDP